MLMYNSHRPTPLNLSQSTTSFPTMFSVSGLERIVLRRNLILMQVSNNRDLLNDVFSDARDVGEEEEGEDTSCGAEVGSGAGAVISQLAVAGFDGGGRGVWVRIGAGRRFGGVLTYKRVIRPNVMPWKCGWALYLFRY